MRTTSAYGTLYSDYVRLMYVRSLLSGSFIALRLIAVRCWTLERFQSHHCNDTMRLAFCAQFAMCDDSLGDLPSVKLYNGIIEKKNLEFLLNIAKMLYETIVQFIRGPVSLYPHQRPY